MGWNVDNRSDSTGHGSEEETMSKRKMDYGVEINRNPKFFLEVGLLKESPLSNLLVPLKMFRRMLLDDVYSGRFKLKGLRVKQNE